MIVSANFILASFSEKIQLAQMLEHPTKNGGSQIFLSGEEIDLLLQAIAEKIKEE